MSEGEFEIALNEIRESIKQDNDKKPSSPPAKKEGDGDEDEQMDEAPPGVEDHEKPPNEEELSGIRAKFIKERRAVYDVTEAAVIKIWTFEEGIKRPYFHVKQLERAQLKNWREYLDNEISRGKHERIVVLFERCLIACALYEDFWLKYAKYMLPHDESKARKIYHRACNIHLPKRPNIHMQWAAFEEITNNIEESSRILEHLDSIVPGMATIKMRRVAVQRRAGNLDEAEKLLRSYVDSAAKDKEELFYTRKLSWFLFKMMDKKDEARTLLRELITKHKSEVKLYNDLVEMEFQCAGANLDQAKEDAALQIFDMALACDKLTDEQKFSFSQKKLEFLEDFGCCVKRLQKVYDEHQKLVKTQKKRGHGDSESKDSPSSSSKRAKIESNNSSATNSSMTNGSRYSSSNSYSQQNHHHQPPHHQQYPGSVDPNMYQQYQQNYWNQQYQQHNKPAADYNYQWNQYYQQQQGRR